MKHFEIESRKPLKDLALGVIFGIIAGIVVAAGIVGILKAVEMGWVG